MTDHERYEKAIATAEREPTEEETQEAREVLVQLQEKARVAGGSAVNQMQAEARAQGKRIPRAQLKWLREAFVLGYTAAITDGIVDEVVGVSVEPDPPRGDPH